MNGLNQLLNSIRSIIGDSEITSDDLLKRLSEDQGCDKEEIIELAKDFFSSLSPEYKEQFEEIISTDKIKLVKDKELSIDDSNSSELILTGNYVDFPVLVHESTHNFGGFKNRAMHFWLLGEVDAICMEMLAIDYLKTKKNVNLDSMYALREADLKESDFFQVDGMKDFIMLASNFKNGNMDFNDDSLRAAKTLSPYWLPGTLFRDNLLISASGITLSGFSHQIGYMLATYIHEKILENPDNIKLLEAVTQAISIEKEQEAIEILSQNGIPIVRDGKLSLDAENIKLLEIYLKKSHERRKFYKTEEGMPQSSMPAKEKPIQELVEEAIAGTPNFTVLDELEGKLKEKPDIIKSIGD